MILAEPSADPRQRLGLLGEAAAERALRAAGLKILQRRFRLRVGEIDLVALDGEILVFVEVKTRRGDGFGSPAEAVTARKRRRMERAALSYLARTRSLDRACRFDVVEVHAVGSTVRRVHHIRDAFRL